MATPRGTGKAAKSSSGASMSAYDVEVESRLKALEAAVKELQVTCATHTHAGGGSDAGDAEKIKGLTEDVKRLRTTLGI